MRIPPGRFAWSNTNPTLDYVEEDGSQRRKMYVTLGIALMIILAITWWILDNTEVFVRTTAI